MEKEVFEQLMEDIHARLESLDGLKEAVSEERIKEIVQNTLSELTEDEKFVRKMRFGKTEEPKLMGTKYARWGLSIADIEWLYDLQESLIGQRKVGGGVYEGPSEALKSTFAAISEAIYLPMDEVRQIDRRAIEDLFPRDPDQLVQGRRPEPGSQGGVGADGRIQAGDQGDGHG